MCESAFISKLSTSEAHECVFQIKSYYKDSNTIKVHFTATGGGDLRVKVGSTNIFTMQWRKTNQRFFCRIYTSTGHCHLPCTDEFVKSQTTPTTTERLKCEFWYQPGKTQGVLINCIDAAIEEFMSKQ